MKPPVRRDGFELLAMWGNGFSHVTTNLPLELAAGEAKGIRMRVAPGSVDAKFISRLGLVSEEIPDERVYDALKSNEVTAQASSLTTIVSGRYFEVQKYLVLSGHAYGPSFLIASVAYFSQLDRETRRAITSVARSLEDWSIETGAGQESKMIDDLRTKMIVRQPDRLMLLLRCVRVYQAYAKDYPGTGPVVKLLYDQSSIGSPLALD